MNSGLEDVFELYNELQNSKNDVAAGGYIPPSPHRHSFRLPSPSSSSFIVSARLFSALLFSLSTTHNYRNLCSTNVPYFLSTFLVSYFSTFLSMATHSDLLLPSVTLFSSVHVSVTAVREGEAARGRGSLQVSSCHGAHLLIIFYFTYFPHLSTPLPLLLPLPFLFLAILLLSYSSPLLLSPIFIRP